jgi:hypothetical protein
MKNGTKFPHEQILITFVALLAGWLLTFPTSSRAQTQGNNAVYYQSGSSGTCCKGSSAFIDASVFATSTSTFCSTLYGILSSTSYSYPSVGAVIDARGLNSNNTTMTCAAGTTPWYNGSTLVSVPSTILLPAGTIFIQATWVLPNNTHLIGVGDGPSGTMIEVLSGTSLTTMIQFGSSSTAVCPSGVCTGISVENLTLNGQAQSVDGIVNQYAQNNSYVNHVLIYQILVAGPPLRFWFRQRWGLRRPASASWLGLISRCACKAEIMGADFAVST